MQQHVIGSHASVSQPPAGNTLNNIGNHDVGNDITSILSSGDDIGVQHDCDEDSPLQDPIGDSTNYAPVQLEGVAKDLRITTKLWVDRVDEDSGISCLRPRL